MSNCGCSSPDNQNQDLPIDEQPPYENCVDSELCDNITDAHCVEYTGPNLQNIGINNKDRLDTILTNLNENQETQAIEAGDTDTIHVSGNGLSSDPLSIEVKLNPDTLNLIQSTSSGLLFKWTKSNLQAFFTLVNSDNDLKNSFCSLFASCGWGDCGVATDLEVTDNFQLTWVPYDNVTLINQVIQYKILGSGNWMNFNTYGPTVSTCTVTGLIPNTIYQFRIVSNCVKGAQNTSSIVNQIKFNCPTLTTIKTLSTIKASFNYDANDIVSYVVSLKKTSDDSLVETLTLPLVPGHGLGQFNYTFDSLIPSTSYYVEVTMLTLNDTYSNTCTSNPIVTLDAPTCSTPHSVTVTMS